MKKLVLILTLVFVLSGCKEKEITNKMEINCNSDITIIDLKKGDEISCKLLNTDYIFKVKSSTESSIKLEVNDYGLNDESSLVDKKKEFIIKKGEDKAIKTQSTDYQQSIIFSWN